MDNSSTPRTSACFIALVRPIFYINNDIPGKRSGNNERDTIESIP